MIENWLNNNLMKNSFIIKFLEYGSNLSNFVKKSLI